MSLASYLPFARWRHLATALLTLFASFLAHAQGAEGPTPAQIQARLDVLLNSTEVSEEVRSAAAANYRAALERLQRSEESRNNQRALQRRVENAQTDAARLEAEREEVLTNLNSLERRLRSVDADAASLRLATLSAQQSEKREAKDKLDQQLASRLTRPLQLRDELADATALVEQLNATASGLEESTEEPQRSEQTLLRARLEAARAERERLQSELATLQPRLELAEVELQLVNAERSLIDREITILAATVAEERESESAQATDSAIELRVRALSLPGPLDEDTADVASLFDELSRTLTSARTVASEVAATSSAREALQRDYDAIKSRVEVAGAQVSLGQLLRNQRLRLADERELQRQLADIRGRSAEAGLRSLELVDLSRQQSVWTELLERHIAAIDAERQVAARAEQKAAEGAEQPSPEPTTSASAEGYSQGIEELRAFAESLTETREGVLDRLTDTYTQYVTLLADRAFEQRSMLTLVREYQAYLDDRLLWVPSAEPINLASLQRVRESAAWLLSGPHWVAALETFVFEVMQNAEWYTIAVLLTLLAVRLRPVLRQAIQRIGVRTRKVRTDGFILTLQAMLLTALLSLLLPSLLIALGIRGQALPLPEQVRALMSVLVFGGGTIALGGFIRHLCMPQGVARLHFQWSESRIRLLPRVFLFVQTVWLPVFALARVAGLQANQEVQSSIGRLAFVLVCLVLAYLVSTLLHPQRGLPAKTLEEQPQGWAARLVRLWYPAAVGLAPALAMVSLLGYEYAATLLLRCVVETVLLLLGAMILFDLLERWIRVTRRRFRYQQLIERRSASAEVPAAADGLPYSAERDGAFQDLDVIDIDVFDDQTRRLMRILVITLTIFGAWFIWSKALPVLGLLDQVALWGDGALTLEDTVVAIVLLFIVLLATRNLPSLLEFAVLQNLPLDSGSRYAIRTVSQYLVVGLGILSVTAQLGLEWSKVQWLVAALSVGLGFGLQEIFANFVSGLIILLERPVRVGDTVTVGGISGTVTRIRIRATTITDWDNKEVIVPNKTFITSQLTNWTLSNEVTRVVVPVGIAYGSDTELAIRTMMDTARSNPLVLAEPPPRVLFTKLGESSLDFELFIYCRALSDRLAARHQLLLDLEEALDRVEISIPFPQRDLHLHYPADTESTPRGREDADRADSASC
ncbi:MAG: mechanosensitive ion channel domain-containing protein [Pseudomonadota bacterium]